MKKFFEKLKNRLIKWLGGWTEREMKEWRIKTWKAEHKAQELEDHFRKVEENRDYWYDSYKYLEDRLQTVNSEILLADHPSWTEENVVERTKELVIRNLGKAAYEQAVHKVENGVYTASVTILDGRANE